MDGMDAMMTMFDENARRLERAETKIDDMHVELARVVGLLRECQSALTGPAELRQRVEDEIGPRQ